MTFEINVSRIHFDKKLILYESNLKFYSGRINMIIGESGSGKSTLINAMTFNNSFARTCFYREEKIDVNNKDYINKFLYSKVAVVYQNQKLISGLTIQDHIDSIKYVFSSRVDEKLWIQKLGLQNVINEYPNNLSGGELIRVNLLLAILKDSEILILDEPTSSLDEYFTDIIISCLNFLKEEKKIIIVASHDEKLIKESDVVYQIANNNTYVLKQIEPIFEKMKKSEVTYSPKIKDLGNILIKTSKYDKLYKKIVTILTIVAIGISAFSTQFNNSVQMNLINQINSLSSNELIVSKPQLGNTEGISFESSESNDLISQDEIDKIKQLSNVKDVKWRIDLSLTNSFNLMVDHPYLYSKPDPYVISVDKVDGDNYSKRLLENDTLLLNTYFNDINYDKEILVKFKNEGVYLTKDFANFLSDGNVEQLDGSSITCNILIPVYNSVGKFWSADEDGNMLGYPTGTSCQVLSLTLPIAGVLKSSNMGIANYYMYAIYMERNELENYMNMYHQKESRVCYVTDTENCTYTVNEPPKDENTIRYTVKENPWTPRSYSVFIKDITLIEETIKQITEIGLSVSNQYFEASSVSTNLEKSKSAIQLVSFSVTLAIILIYIALKYNNLTEEKNINKFYKNIGLQQRDIFKIKAKRNMLQTLKMYFWGIIVISFVLVILNEMHFGYTEYDKVMFITLGVITFIIEFFIPMIMERFIYD